MSGMGGQQDDRNSMALLWIIAFIFIAGVIIWFAFEDQLKIVFINLRMAEIWLVALVVDILPSGIPIFGELQNNVDRTLQVTQALTPENLTLDYAAQLSGIVGGYIRWPIAICLGLFCYLMYGRNVKMRYRKKYDMHSLAHQESAVWPQINPVIGAKIDQQDIDKGPWAMAMAPLGFCKRYKIISINVEMPTSSLSGGPKFNMVLNKSRTDRVFGAQLGRMWNGPERLPIHRRALFAALVARGSRDTEAARNLLQQINRSCAGGKLDRLDFSGADALWKKHVDNRGIQDILKGHAYEATIFMALFLYAREDGVFATADFLWLKPFDRKFWYIMNNVGRQVAFCEAAGVHAHYLAEKALRRPLGVPMVQEATKALDLALADIVYVPTPEEKDELLKQFEAG